MKSLTVNFNILTADIKFILMIKQLMASLLCNQWFKEKRSGAKFTGSTIFGGCTPAFFRIWINDQKSSNLRALCADYWYRTIEDNGWYQVLTPGYSVPCTLVPGTWYTVILNYWYEVTTYLGFYGNPTSENYAAANSLTSHFAPGSWTPWRFLVNEMFVDTRSYAIYNGKRFKALPWQIWLNREMRRLWNYISIGGQETV